MKKIENLFIKLVERNNSPSVQYILFDKNSIIMRYSNGFADIKGRKEVNEMTTYNAYSVTKTFTALAVLQLAEQKKLEINEPVCKYWPDFPYSPDITIRQLLSHSAGIPNPVPLSWIHPSGEHIIFDRDKFFDPIYARNKKTRSEPNGKFAYSNLGYILLGKVIEKVSGMIYEKYITENIIERLGLSTGELGFEIAKTDGHARGYHKKLSFSNLILGFFIDKAEYMNKSEGIWKPFKDFYVNGTSYGGLIGTPQAFVKYIRELLKSGGQLISDEYKKIMFTENRTNDNKPTGMCLSWFSGQLNGNKYFAHAGGGGGYYCEIRIYPDTGVGSVVFFNRTGMSDKRFLDKVDKIFFENREI